MFPSIVYKNSPSSKCGRSASPQGADPITKNVWILSSSQRPAHSHGSGAPATLCSLALRWDSLERQQVGGVLAEIHTGTEPQLLAADRKHPHTVAQESTARWGEMGPARVWGDPW